MSHSRESNLPLKKKLSKYIKYVTNLSPSIKNSIKWYTEHNYKKFNKMLREDIMLDSEMLSHLHNLDEAFSDAPVLDFPITVFRGIKKESESIADKSFMSTTIDFDIATGFSECCIMEITIAAGNKILPLWDISDQYDEFEILLNRNQILTITHEKKDLKKTFYATFLPDTTKIIHDETPSVKTIEEKFNDDKVHINIANSIIELLSDPDERELIDLDINDTEQLTSEIVSQYKMYASRLHTGTTIPNGILNMILSKIK